MLQRSSGPFSAASAERLTLTSCIASIQGIYTKPPPPLVSGAPDSRVKAANWVNAYNRPASSYVLIPRRENDLCVIEK